MHNNRARITIKLGQADQTKKPDEVGKVAKGEIEEIDETDDQIEDEQSPEIKAESRRTSSHAKRFFSTIRTKALGKENPVETEVPSFGPKYVAVEEKNKKTRRPLYRDVNSKGVLGIVASSIGAVAVGLVFGFIILSFFQSGINQESDFAPAEVTAKESPSVEASGLQGTVTEEESSITLPGATNEPLLIQVPARAYFVAQGGVFKDEASAASVVEEMKSKGLPSGFSGEEPAHLFLGIGVDRDHILAVASNLEDEMEVYVKEITEEEKTLSVELKEGIMSSQEEWNHWFERERTFISEIGTAIREALNTGNLTAEQFSQTTDSHRELLQAGREIVAKLPASEQSLGNRLLNDYTKAVTAMEQYQKQPAVGYLWQAQQALLDAYSSKEKLFVSFE